MQFVLCIDMKNNENEFVRINLSATILTILVLSPMHSCQHLVVRVVWGRQAVLLIFCSFSGFVCKDLVIYLCWLLHNGGKIRPHRNSFLCHSRIRFQIFIVKTLIFFKKQIIIKITSTENYLKPRVTSFSSIFVGLGLYQLEKFMTYMYGLESVHHKYSRCLVRHLWLANQGTRVLRGWQWLWQTFSYHYSISSIDIKILGLMKHVTYHVSSTSMSCW